MAAPKPALPSTLLEQWGFLSEDESVAFDEQRFADILNRPGVTVRQRNPELARTRFPPIGMVGHISVAELRRLLGREGDPEEEESGFVDAEGRV
ncbi:MAG TPA: hypothetical protein VMP03_03850 [Methylomirabilota bacterium]|nr:hypothetical protein [Methylomirabilota bacterium]